MLMKHTEYKINVMIKYMCLFLRNIGFIKPMHLGFFPWGGAKTLNGSGQPGPFLSWGRSFKVPSVFDTLGNARIGAGTIGEGAQTATVTLFGQYSTLSPPVPPARPSATHL
jgi:hypothetical protein